MKIVVPTVATDLISYRCNLHQQMFLRRQAFQNAIEFLCSAWQLRQRKVKLYSTLEPSVVNVAAS